MEEQPVTTAPTIKVDKPHKAPTQPGKRRPGPWRVWEICTMACMISMAACQMGWVSLEPTTMPRYDLTRSRDRERAHDWIERGDPDFLGFA